MNNQTSCVPLLDKLMQSKGEPILQQPQNTAQPKTEPKVSFPNYRPHDKFILVPHMRSGKDSMSKMINRETIWNISREILPYADPIYRSPLKLAEIPLQETQEFNGFEQ